MKKFTQQLLSSIVALAFLSMGTPVAYAASPTEAKDVMTRHKVSEAATHAISFKLPTALANGGTITVTFPAGFGGTATISSSPNWTASGKVATYTAPAPQAAGASYNVTVTGLTNPGTGGNQTITIISSNGDAGEITVPIITNDQISVSAKVNQTLSFAVSDMAGTGNSVGFGSLSSSSLNYATQTGANSTTPVDASKFTAGTNATGGYTVSVEGQTLTDGVKTIPAINPAAAPAAGTPGFGIAVNGSGTEHGTISTNYSGTNYYLNASAPDVMVTRTTPGNNATYNVRYAANIAASTPAGNYTTALTYTMSANF